MTLTFARPLLAALAVTLLAALLPAPARATQSGTAEAAVTCKRLAVTKKLRRTLRRVHAAQLRRFDSPSTITGGPTEVRYGRCGARFYALATFTHEADGQDFGDQDQPERFTRRRGRAWRDRGDTGGDVCSTAPKALVNLWGYRERCAVPEPEPSER